MSDFIVRPTTEQDREWITQLAEEHWGGAIVVSRGQVWEPARLPGYIAVMDGERVGLASYRIDADEAELVMLNSLIERKGIGAALIREVVETARGAGCLRLWLITTNDNTHALRFYQRNAFVLAALHRDAIATSRQIKPSIPLTGFDGIPIRDEIELEMRL